MANGLARNVAPGRHTRRPTPQGLRPACLAALIMLVVQYGLGIFLNLYVAVPSSDQHAGLLQEIATAPFSLTLHALLGLALIGTAIALLVRAVAVGSRPIIVLAAAGLAAIGGAFAAGEMFVRDGQSAASFAMAALTGVALLCYVAALALASAPHRERPRRAVPPPADAAAAPWISPAIPRREPAVRPGAMPRREAAVRPATMPRREAAAPLPRRSLSRPPAPWFTRE
jgi:hypothetical protein